MRENTVKQILLFLFVAWFILLSILLPIGGALFCTIFPMVITSVLFLIHKYQITFSKQLLITALFLFCCVLGYYKGIQIFFQSFVVLGTAGILIWIFIKDPDRKLSEPDTIKPKEILKKLVTRPEPYFAGKGSKIEIGGYILEDTLIYVVDSKTYENFDASLLCLRRPIGLPQETCERTLPYWPCLSDTDSTQVANYIRWIVTGRKDPNIELGFVFIYFYGLERGALP